MVQPENQGDFLHEDEDVATAVLLMIAGHETTSNLLANGMLAFLHHPEQIDLLRRDPNLISQLSKSACAMTRQSRRRCDGPGKT